MADALRVTGNDAARGVEAEIGKEDAADAIAFTEALAYLFVYRNRYEEFLERRKKRKKRPGSSGG
ncbi:MAG TPA: hypothetical protein VFB78_00880 [Acidimicrobiales bacterium]|nr:hypothetical protein [Acidimicrobiales bacterium]